MRIMQEVIDPIRSIWGRFGTGTEADLAASYPIPPLEFDAFVAVLNRSKIVFGSAGLG